MSEFLSMPSMDYESFMTSFHSYCGRFNAKRVESENFIGRINARDLFDVEVLDIQCNAERIDRAQQDIRLDGVNHYYALVQIKGECVVVQKDRVMKLQVGDVALLDAARPVVAYGWDQPGQWIAFHFPRRVLASHFGFEPSAASARGDTLPGRLLFQLGRDTARVAEADTGEADPFMHSVIYDLMAAMFAAPNPHVVSGHSDKLFARLCRIIRGRYAEPDLNPSDVAAEAGISVRYLQKLFTVRGSSFTHLIQSLRLDHAAQHLERREQLHSKQSLSEIAYACGFRDYTHFARRFRLRFGHAPGAHAERHGNATKIKGASSTDWSSRHRPASARQF
jgi:AraC family transcriptional regulator, positive regulator of tynA and feaB